jgi:hypothetical protein
VQGVVPVAVGDSDSESDADYEYCLEPGNAMTSEDDTHLAGGDQMSINTGGGNCVDSGGGDVAGRDLDKRQGEIFVEGNVYGDVVREQHIYYQPVITPLDRQQQRNRRAMLTKVRTIWIDACWNNRSPKSCASHST